MLKRNKHTKVEKEKTKLELRVAKMATQDLTQWVDQALYSIGKNLTQWSKTQDNVFLQESHMGAEALLAVINELNKRYND
jgi:hypothetical protein